MDTAHSINTAVVSFGQDPEPLRKDTPRHTPTRRNATNANLHHVRRSLLPSVAVDLMSPNVPVQRRATAAEAHKHPRKTSCDGRARALYASPARCNGLLDGALAIDLSAMPDLVDRDFAGVVIDFIDHPIVPLPDAIPIIVAG